MLRFGKQTDLWIVATLVLGVFAFQYGEQAWAAVQPRLAAMGEVFAAKLAEVVATEGAPTADAVPPEGAASPPPGVVPGSAAGQASSFPGGVSPDLPPGAFAGDPRIVVVPGCRSAYGYGCSW